MPYYKCLIIKQQLKKHHFLQIIEVSEQITITIKKAFGIGGHYCCSEQNTKWLFDYYKLELFGSGE